MDSMQHWVNALTPTLEQIEAEDPECLLAECSLLIRALNKDRLELLAKMEELPD